MTAKVFKRRQSQNFITNRPVLKYAYIRIGHESQWIPNPQESPYLVGIGDFFWRLPFLAQLVLRFVFPLDAVDWWDDWMGNGVGWAVKMRCYENNFRNQGFFVFLLSDLPGVTRTPEFGVNNEKSRLQVASKNNIA